MPYFTAPLIAPNGSQVNGYISPRVYGAKGDENTDDTVAIQNAINAAKAFNGGINGGTVVLDGAFRITNTLSVDASVSFSGVGAGVGGGGDGSAIFMDHPTRGIFSWTTTQGSYKTKSRISNLLLAGIQPNSGNVLDFTGGLLMNLLLDNVTLNQNVSGNLNGRLFGFNSTAGRLALRNCRLHATGAAAHLITEDSTGADLSLDHCEVITATNRTATVFNLSSGQFAITDTEFLSGLNPGASWIDLGASATGKSCRNTFYNLDTTAIVAHTYANGAGLIAKDNFYDQDTYPTLLSTGGHVLSNGSKIELLPYGSFPNSSSSTSLKSIYDVLTFVESSTTAPSYILPSIQFQGQRFTFNLTNISLTTWAPTFVGVGAGAYLATIVSLAGGGDHGIYHFEANDVYTPGVTEWALVAVAHT